MNTNFTHFCTEVHTTAKKSYKSDWQDVRVFATQLQGRSGIPIDQCWAIFEQYVNNLARFESDKNFTMWTKGTVTYFNPANITAFTVYKK